MRLLWSVYRVKLFFAVSDIENVTQSRKWLHASLSIEPFFKTLNHARINATINGSIGVLAKIKPFLEKTINFR